GIRTYLDEIEYAYAAEHSLNVLLSMCYAHADYVDLDIDITNKTGDTIGLECSFNQMERALKFLDQIHLNGFCVEDKHEPLKLYLRSLDMDRTGEFLPFFSHFKIVYHPDRPVKTKAYLGFADRKSASKIIRTKSLKHYT